MDRYLPLLLAIPFLLMKSSSANASSSGNSGNSSFPDVAKIADVPFAMSNSNLRWPVITKHVRGHEVPYKTLDGKYVGNSARSFGVPRQDGIRKHAAIDLYCYGDDVVIAMESGTVVGIQGFLGPTKALLIQGDSGVVSLYGEIKNNSWSEFALKKGTKVKAGQPIARIGINDAGTSMLHFETYTKGTTQNAQWKGSPPSNLLNPTKYLLQAQKNFNNS